MSSFPPASHPSAACCSIPPVVATGYEEKGTYEELGGYKTCTLSLEPIPSLREGFGPPIPGTILVEEGFEYTILVLRCCRR